MEQKRYSVTRYGHKIQEGQKMSRITSSGAGGPLTPPKLKRKRQRSSSGKDNIMADQTQLTQEEVEAIKAMRGHQTRLDKIRNALNNVDPTLLIGLGALVLLVWTVSTI